MYYLKPEANWGSSAEALVFLNALNNTYSLNEQQDHIKTYRPKVLLLTGNPIHRQPLLDFANLLTKKLSLLICANIVTEEEKEIMVAMKESIELWLKDHNIRSFYSVIPNNKFSQGVQNTILLSGLGKLTPNMVIMGFNSNRQNMNVIEEYFQTLVIAFENRMAVGILRLPNGNDYSSHIVSEETTVEEGSMKKRGMKEKNVIAVFRGKDGKVLPKQIVDDITQFKSKKRDGFIDVWWLYDDGGLTLLLPYILQTRKQFKDCKLRVFSLSNKAEDFDRETRSLANLLAKFRISFSEVLVIPDITKKAKPETKPVDIGPDEIESGKAEHVEIESN